LGSNKKKYGKILECGTKLQDTFFLEQLQNPIFDFRFKGSALVLCNLAQCSATVPTIIGVRLVQVMAFDTWSWSRRGLFRLAFLDHASFRLELVVHVLFRQLDGLFPRRLRSGNSQGRQPTGQSEIPSDGGR